MMIPRTHLILMALLLVGAFGLSAWYYPQLPERVPTHWNIRGEIDQYGPKWVNTWLMPCVSAGIGVLMLALPALGPLRKNFSEFREAYGRFVVVLVGLFVAIHAVILLQSAGVKFPIGSALSIIIGATFVLMGNWFAKIRRNFYLGIRTPWTLSNELVWDRTHRVGGRLFMLTGVASIIAGVAAPQWMAFVVMMGGLIVTTVWSLVYSYVEYRRVVPDDA